MFLFGAGLHCNVVIDIVEQEVKYKIAGIVDSIKKLGIEKHYKQKAEKIFKL